MKQIHLKEMYDAGVHLGSNIKKINPKMRPYVMCVHEGIAIIDILKTYTRLFRITLFLKKVIATEGYRVLFVGTQKSIAPIIAEIARKSSSNYVNERWKGGYLTNFKTVLRTSGINKNQILNSESGSSLSGTSEFAGTQNKLISSDSSNKINAEKNLSSKNQEKRFQFSGSESLPSSANSRVNYEESAEKKNQTKTKGKFDSERNRNKTEDSLKNSLPDIVIIVGQEKEMKAIKECEKLNIPIITILDSDGDPSLTNLFIPANDDSRTSVEFILKHIGQAILVGRLLHEKVRVDR